MARAAVDHSNAAPNVIRAPSARSALSLALVLLGGCVAATPAHNPIPSVPLAVAPPPESPKPISLEALTAELIAAAARHDFVAASQHFGSAMKAALPPEKFAATWSAVEHQLGVFQALDEVRVQAQDGLRAALGSAHFEHGPVIIKVVFDDDTRVAGLFFQPVSSPWQAPPYANPAAFEEHAVSVGTDPALPGTLTLPKSEVPVPAVVLIHGSGPNDADETVAGVKPFKDLAWGLASEGIAVLRYVKRSRQAPAGIVTQKEEVLDAAHAAIELLRATPGIDAKRIFVVGHSEGGALAPRIVQQNPPLAGFVVLAGPTQPVQDSLLAQLQYFASTSGTTPALTAGIEAAQRFKQTVEDPHLKPDEDVALPTGGTLKGAYFIEQRGYDPVKVARALPGAALVLHGEQDHQVSSVEYQNWVTGLAKRKGTAFKSYPSLNHLFVSGTGPSTPREYQQVAHVDEAVVKDIARWLRGEAL